MTPEERNSPEHLAIEKAAREQIEEWVKQPGQCWCVVARSLAMLIEMRSTIQALTGASDDELREMKMEFAGVSNVPIADILKSRVPHGTGAKGTKPPVS